MKKRFIKAITLILSVVMGAACLGGCNLITDNLDRDLNQIVATVNVNQEEHVYKKDLVMAYMNYGYIYTQYYGYDAAKTYNLILNNLIDNRIVVQYAYEAFEEDGSVKKDDAKAKYTAERYLTAEEIIDAKYSTYKSINDLLDGYSEEDGASGKQDTVIMDVRTVPTDAQNAEKDVDKAAYVKNIDDNGFDVNSTEYKRAAFGKVVALLEENGLLGGEYNGDIKTSDYFARLLKSNYENEIIEKYEESVVKGVRNSLKYEDLQTAYKEKLGTQQSWSNSEFVSALSSASATSPILYSAYGTYGYVYNLLLGVSDKQNEKISDLQEEREHTPLTEKQYAESRKDILAETVAKDLRSSWILSGYDFNYNTEDKTGVFTGDYTFAKDENNSLAFQGKVSQVRAANEEKNISAVYSVDSVKTFGLKEFTQFVNKYVYGDEHDISDELSDNVNRYYEKAAIADKPQEYDAKINELLFAFSTDSGSLNTYKGYVIKPENTEYVKTFGDAGKALLQAGGSSYMVVASDYGYHFMFFSEVWKGNDEDPDYGTLEAYLNTLDIDGEKDAAGWEEYFNAKKATKKAWEDFEEENNFLYILASERISSALSDAASRSRANIITKYRYGEKKDSVVIYKDRFADLLG